MSLSTQIAAYAGLTAAQIFGVKPPLVQLVGDGDGAVSIAVWNVPNVAEPTSDQISAWLSAAPLLTDLATTLLKLAAATCNAVTNQVTVTETHVPAYGNAAGWVAQAGGVPTVDPYKTSFENLAATMKAQPPDLATMFAAFAVAPVNLIAALNVLKASAATAQSTNDLAVALAAFQNTVQTEVNKLNTALQAAKVADVIVVPPAITITGINA